VALNKPLSEGTRPFKMHRSVIIYQPSSGARTPKSLPSPDPPTSVTETQRQGVWGRTELTLYRIILLNHSAFSCPSCFLPSIKSYFHVNSAGRSVHTVWLAVVYLCCLLHLLRYLYIVALIPSRCAPRPCPATMPTSEARSHQPTCFCPPMSFRPPPTCVSAAARPLRTVAAC
jgi:hypothetical protein